MNSLPLEIERKYIIKMPDMSLIESQNGYTKSDITQIYLESVSGVTHRVRSRAFDEKTVYTETKKIRIDKMSSIEDEREISKDEFLRLSNNQKQGTKAVCKTRFTLRHENFILEIDVYPEWQKTCIMEIELESEAALVKIPDFIEILKEVTGDRKYTNAAMAEKFPEELI